MDDGVLTAKVGSGDAPNVFHEGSALWSLEVIVQASIGVEVRVHSGHDVPSRLQKRDETGTDISFVTCNENLHEMGPVER
jgi:hypothetical protein